MAQDPLDVIRSLASSYPEAETTFLLGDHEVFRVRKKVFVWLGEDEKGGTYISVKLKDSQQTALMLPFVTPAAYGMAKWGWIKADFPKGRFPADLVKEWIDESYRHTAPKKLLKLLDSGQAAPPSTKTSTKSKSKRARTPSRPAARRKRAQRA